MNIMMARGQRSCNLNLGTGLRKASGAPSAVLGALAILTFSCLTANGGGTGHVVHIAPGLSYQTDVPPPMVTDNGVGGVETIVPYGFTFDCARLRLNFWRVTREGARAPAAIRPVGTVNVKRGERDPKIDSRAPLPAPRLFDGGD